MKIDSKRLYEISAYEASKGMTVECTSNKVFQVYFEFRGLLVRGEFNSIDDLEADVFLRLQYPIEKFRVEYDKWIAKHNGAV